MIKISFFWNTSNNSGKKNSLNETLEEKAELSFNLAYSSVLKKNSKINTYILIICVMWNS